MRLKVSYVKNSLSRAGFEGPIRQLVGRRSRNPKMRVPIARDNESRISMNLVSNLV